MNLSSKAFGKFLEGSKVEEARIVDKLLKQIASRMALYRPEMDT